MMFLHAADLHLDSPLAGLAQRNPELARLAADCTRRALANLVDVAIERDVAFVLIAGDVYDADWKDYGTGLAFAAEMRRLARPCFVINGNHDAASVITRSLQLPANVHVFGSRAPAVVERPELGVAIHGQSFPNRAVPEDLAALYKAPVPGLFNIGMLHSSVEDPGAHGTYAPTRLQTLVNKGYDYWALGHIHTSGTLHEHPTIHFPGNIQGRHVNEAGSRGITLVHVGDAGAIRLEHHATDVLRWAAVPVDLGGAATIPEALARLRFELAAARQAAAGRPVIARVTLHGATPLHAELLADPDRMASEAANAAMDLGDDVHIERVRVRTAPIPGSSPALDGLEEAFAAALDDPAVMDALLQDFAKLGSAIPSGAAIEVPRDAGALAALREDAWQLVRHALAAGGGA